MSPRDARSADRHASRPLCFRPIGDDGARLQARAEATGESVNALLAAMVHEALLKDDGDSLPRVAG